MRQHSEMRRVGRLESMCERAGGLVEAGVVERVRRSNGMMLYEALERDVRSSEVVISPGIRPRRVEERVIADVFWAVLAGKSISW